MIDHGGDPTDALDPLADGMHRGIAWESLPAEAQDKQGYILAEDYAVSDGAVQWGRRTFTSPHDGVIWINSCVVGTWLGWKMLATATPPQRYVLQLTDGWVRVNAAEYWRTQEGLVVVTFRIARSGGAEIHAELYPVAILPEGFRPVGYAAHAAASTMTAVPAVVWVGDDGVIYASAAQDVRGSSDPAPGNWPGFVATLVFTAS